MGSRLLSAGILAWLAVVPLARADEGPFPPGRSEDVHDETEFDILMPEAFDPARAYSLVMVICGDVASGKHLLADGYIVAGPRLKYDSNGILEGGEAKAVLALTRYLMKELDIAPHKVHAIGLGDTQGALPSIAFSKKSPFVSTTFVDCTYSVGAVSGHLKKRMGVLAFDATGRYTQDIKRVRTALPGKVRTVELRKDADGIAGEYFRWWLGTMDGRYRPGVDRSFAWVEEVADEAALKALVPKRRKGLLVYFWSASDAEGKAGPPLQREVLTHADVRTGAKALVPVKLEREQHAALFERFGLKATPSLVVLDRDLKVLARLEGAVKTKKLVSAMKKAR